MFAGAFDQLLAATKSVVEKTDFVRVVSEKDATVADVGQKLEHAAREAQQLAAKLQSLAVDQSVNSALAPAAAGPDFFIIGLTIFVLACFVGYYVVWRVTPALHSPLMAVTNAISSVVIIGALIAAGPIEFTFAKSMGLIGVVLAAINIFGGFLVTERMLQMYRKKGK